MNLKYLLTKTMMKLNDQREMLDDFANKQTQTIQNIIINEEYNIDIILNKHIKKCISRVNKQRIEIEENINDMDKHIKSEFNDVVSEIKTKMFLNVKQLMDSPDYKCILENALNSRIIHIEEYSINNRDNCVNKPCYIKNTNQHLVISMCNNIDDVIKSKSREKKWAIRKKYEKRIKKCETEFNDYKSSVKLELNTIGYAREKYKKKIRLLKETIRKPFMLKKGKNEKDGKNDDDIIDPELKWNFNNFDEWINTFNVIIPKLNVKTKDKTKSNQYYDMELFIKRINEYDDYFVDD